MEKIDEIVIYKVCYEKSPFKGAEFSFSLAGKKVNLEFVDFEGDQAVLQCDKDEWDGFDLTQDNFETKSEDGKMFIKVPMSDFYHSLIDYMRIYATRSQLEKYGVENLISQRLRKRAVYDVEELLYCEEVDSLEDLQQEFESELSSKKESSPTTST